MDGPLVSVSPKTPTSGTRWNFHRQFSNVTFHASNIIYGTYFYPWTETQYFNLKKTDIIISVSLVFRHMFETLQIWALLTPLWGLVTSQRGQISKFLKVDLRIVFYIQKLILAIQALLLEALQIWSLFAPLCG